MLDTLSPSTFLTARLKPLGTFSEIFNAQVILCFNFVDRCLQMAFVMYSFPGSEGVEYEQGPPVEEFMVLANSL